MIKTKHDFEKTCYNPFEKTDSNFRDDKDPDSNYFDEIDLQHYETPYLYCENIKSLINDPLSNETISIIHLNIRSLNANLENFKNLLTESNYCFNIICLSETWCTDEEFSNNSFYHIPNYEPIHCQRKTNKRGGGVLIYIRQNLNYKIRNDLTFSNSDNELLTVEIINENTKNLIVTCCYRPPSGNQNTINSQLTKVLQSSTSENKNYIILGDFNINCFNYHEDTSVKNFYDNLYQYGVIPLINKPTRVTTKSATLIDNIFTNFIFDMSLKKGIIKSDISDHFPIFVSVNISKIKNNHKGKTVVKKRTFNQRDIQSFKDDLLNINWSILDSNETDNNYDYFLKMFSDLYDKNFPIKEYTVKIKDLNTPWISKGIKKSSKLKQRLYIKFLKNRTDYNETRYKNLFEKIKKHAKNNYYSSLLEKYQNNAKKSWLIMKKITGKLTSQKSFPKTLNTAQGLITNKQNMANEFNKFFTNIGPKLASKIQNVNTNFKQYLPKIETKMQFHELTKEEFEQVFKSMKRNKAKGIDDINGNVVLDVYNEIKEPLFKIFKSSLKNGVFPNALKYAKVRPIFKSGDTAEIGNYRPISVLPFFSKILEKIMYNRVYNYLIKHNLIYNKQFGFQANNSTEHALMELSSKISDSFENGEYE